MCSNVYLFHTQSKHCILIPQVFSNISLMNDQPCIELTPLCINSSLGHDPKAYGRVVLIVDNYASVIRDPIRHLSYMLPHYVVAVKKLLLSRL